MRSFRAFSCHHRLAALRRITRPNCRVPIKGLASAASSSKDISLQPTFMNMMQTLERLPDNYRQEQQEKKIYPNLDQLRYNLTDSDAVDSDAVEAVEAVSAYVRRQRALLQSDFHRSMHLFTKNMSRLPGLVNGSVILHNVQIKPNNSMTSKGANANCFLLDIIATKRKGITNCIELDDTERKFLMNLKTGTLLCFSTSWNLDDLILTTVAYTEEKLFAKAYVAVDIVAQENITHILHKPLIVFESPLFFEPYYRTFNRLSNLTIESFPMRDYIVHGKTTPERISSPAKQTTSQKTAVNFNDSQEVAFNKALQFEFCLIQGPPGTGKTSLSVELVRALIADSKRRHAGPILLITYTNEALDKFLVKLSEHNQNIVRLGNQIRSEKIEKFAKLNKAADYALSIRLSRTHRWLQERYQYKFRKLNNLYSKKAEGSDNFKSILALLSEMRTLRLQLSTTRTMSQYHSLQDKDVIAMTTTYAARSSELFHLLESQTVIFEEAAEIAEPHIVACLPSTTRQVIMIGDHKQLQPHISQLVGETPLNVSLFERLISQGMDYSQLKVQYRMRRCIAELLVPDIYTELHSDVSVDNYPPVRAMSKDLFFVTHKQHEVRDTSGSYRNVHEAKQLSSLVMHLLSHGKYKPADIVVLTPYSAQVAVLCAELLLYKINDVKVSTVDSFQGLEANIVLLSLVRCNKEQNIGFLGASNRICVALSRAKHGLYIIGDLDTLAGRSRIWSAMKDKLKARQCIGTTFPKS